MGEIINKGNWTVDGKIKMEKQENGMWMERE